MANYTRDSIIRYLDDCVTKPYCFFMDLQHGYFYTANSRLSLFGDDEHWAIVFEKSGYLNRSMCFGLELNYFGHGLCNLDRGGLDGRFICNAKHIELTSRKDLAEVESAFEEVAPGAKQVRLRGEYVALPPSLEGYRKWFPEWAPRARPSPIQSEELCRYLAFEYEDRCRATMSELRTCLPDGLPFLMHIDAWHHRWYYYYENGSDKEFMGDKPSSYETFPLIADVLVSHDPGKFRPTLKANNHWRNWPEAGSL